MFLSFATLEALFPASYFVSKGLAKRENVFPETPVARACFPDVSQFCHTGSIVSSVNLSLKSKICFCYTAKTFHVSAQHELLFIYN